MLFDSAELLFAAVTLLCSLLYLFPYARLIHEQLAAQERSAQSSDSAPVPAPDTNRAVNEETQLEMEDHTVVLHHRDHSSNNDTDNRICPSALEMLPSKSRVQKAGSTPAKAPKIIQHRSSPTQYWKCPDCSFRLDHYSGLHTTEAQVGNSSYLIEYSDRFFVKSHIRQRHETHPRHSSQPRLGCHLCILKSAEEGEAKGDYNRLVTAWEGRDALLQHIADRHLKRFPCPKVMQVVDGTLDSRTQEADIRFWKR